MQKLKLISVSKAKVEKTMNVRLTTKFVNDVVLDVVNEQAIPIIDLLRKHSNLSEFVIADKLKYDIHLVRHLLYKLHDSNLVTYIRKKDRQKGWYISYWTFDQHRVKDLVIRMKVNKHDKLKDRLVKEENNKNCFFMCESACVRIDFEQGYNFDFKCPECGNLLNQQDNTKTIQNIKEQIKLLEKELKL